MRSQFTQSVNGVNQRVTVEPVSDEEIDPLRVQAAKERIRFTGHTEMFAIKNQDGQILAFAGIDFQRSKAVFKNDYVLPEYRRNGFWGILFLYRKLIAIKRETKVIEATCTDMSLGLYKKAGAKVVKQYKDLTKVRIAL